MQASAGSDAASGSFGSPPLADRDPLASSVLARGQNSAEWTQYLANAAHRYDRPVASEAAEIVLRALAPGDEAELLRIHETPEVVRWWDAPEEGFPWDEPSSTRLAVVMGGAIVGLIQYWEEREPRYRHAGIDLFVDPALHGRGIGAEAVRRVALLLIGERGHHRITIDPAVDNAAAIRCYEKVGFRRVGVLRRAERDVGGPGWHDVLLMELLADDLAC
jgi:aminoglycoside 6'-N-acetyltransferase